MFLCHLSSWRQSSLSRIVIVFIPDSGVVGYDSKSASDMESAEPPLREPSLFSKLHLNLTVSETTLTYNGFGNNQQPTTRSSQCGIRVCQRFRDFNEYAFDIKTCR